MTRGLERDGSRRMAGARANIKPYPLAEKPAGKLNVSDPDSRNLKNEAIEALVGQGIQTLIAPDADKRKEPRPGRRGGLYDFTRRVLATRQNPSTTPEHTRARSAHRPPEFHGPQPFARHPPREAAVGWGHSRDWPQRPS